MISEADHGVKDPSAEERDEDLIAAYNRGNTRALGILVERYKKPLSNYLARMTDSAADTDEIFQETWMRVITKSHGFRTDQFKSWLFRIAHNLIVDRSRRQSKQVSLDAPMGGDDNPHTLADRLVSPGPGPDSRASKRDLGKAVAEALEQLSADQREVVMLRIEQNMAFKDIAKVQRVSLNTALSRMHYAVTRMKTLLKDLETETETTT